MERPLVLSKKTLVDTFHGREAFLLFRIQSVFMDRSIIYANFAALVNPSESVLHPVGVISFLEIFPCMSTSALLACLSTVHCDRCICKKVFELQRLDQICVPHKTSVFQLDISKCAVHLADLLAPLFQSSLRPKHSSIVLHHPLHVQSNISGLPRSAGISYPVQIRYGRLACVFRKGLVWHSWFDSLCSSEGTGPSEDHNVEEGVGAETIGTVN
mmetsp:Transcript_3979/g.6122  ORF Transcript_3979/g.6122 Transcript_3979/m.6122 type:complete len:214 (-) Transcript_3979:1430-2071(-)